MEKFIEVSDKRKYFEENGIYDYSHLGLKDVYEELVVQCVHCDDVYHIKEFKVIEKDGNEFIVCRNAPKCNGDAMDMFSTNDNFKNQVNGRNS
jgi:hypothetical protein